MQSLGREAQSLAKRSTKIQEAATAVHQTADVVHHDAEALHQKADRTRGQTKPGKTKIVRGCERFLIVGVGASAGGFEAFTQLLGSIPTQTGMAFVLVQHLDPLHQSQLTDLLSRSTQLPVMEIEDRMTVEPNHVYVIPENRALEIKDGVLRLVSRKKTDGYFFTVDHFLKSLAQDQGNCAVGVILSGTGHDGTIGLQAIKAEGGLTFVQDARSAKFSGMPGNALQSGGIDFVLSPEGIASELGRIAEQSTAKGKAPTEPTAQLQGSEKELLRIFSILRTATGVDFSFYKMTTLQRRMNRRMMLKKMDNLDDYLTLLQRQPAEIDSLFQDLLINVTSFFRDQQVFEALTRKIFPKIVKQKHAGSPVRVWVPGCSTGEEVYSLAICLHEFFGKNLNNRSIQIFGTDISENVIARARAGIYPKNISADVSEERLRRYFQKVDDGYQIAKFIRDVCIFAKQNVVEDPPFSKLDLISCRNLLIYLGPVLQKKVLPIFHYSLRPGGYLMLGTSESIGGFSNLFSLIDKKNKIYTRHETYSRPDFEFSPASAAPVEPPASGRMISARKPQHGLDFEQRANEVLLSHYTPPGVVVNARMEVLQFRGKTGPYLEPSPGTASLNLLKMVREELIVDLRTALMSALKSNASVSKEPIHLKSSGQARDVKIEVIPLRTKGSSERFFLVLFHDVTGAAAPEPIKGERRPAKVLRQSQGEVRRLREEIGQTKESLQSIIEEQEATNEELKSANEEIQSSNEELQSTNEELETAKEELQSTNEELTTLNEELQNRNFDLSQANNDLNNLIGSFSMPMLMLDNELKIRRFTPLAERLFNLIPGDVGRRISDINPNIIVQNLDKVVTEVIDNLNMREIEVQDREGHWYSLRIRPYRTSENKIEGAVLVLVDIGEMREGLEEVAEMVSEPMLILTKDLRISKANQAFHDTFQLSEKGLEGKLLSELSQQWNIPELQHVLEEVLPKDKRVDNFRIEGEFPRVGRRTILVSARKLYQSARGTCYVLVRFDDQSKAMVPRTPGEKS